MKIWIYVDRKEGQLLDGSGVPQLLGIDKPWEKFQNCEHMKKSNPDGFYHPSCKPTVWADKNAVLKVCKRISKYNEIVDRGNEVDVVSNDDKGRIRTFVEITI